ncbi:MAG: TRAP transporter small permease [Pseudochelatococcus sp.]|jgi:TRAP-type C4-dicarboxylate transport system permease small subunit|uniref:TRAP transporter small permease n=1 Tax=Pseudochelatococcus sp. TaxID=2020869 RepID=UPI003D8EEE16
MQHAENAAPQPLVLWRGMIWLSEKLLSMERGAVALLMFLLSGAILLNVATRYSGHPIYWVDELAVYCMVWLTFIGASVMTRLRLDFAVTMLTERLSRRAAAVARVIATTLVVVFGVSVAVMCWVWLDPLGIAGAGFSARDYAAGSFNFVYTERTQTLNWPTWVIYMILPVFAVSITIHGLANLMEDTGRVPAVKRDLTINAEEAVN